MSMSQAGVLISISAIQKLKGKVGLKIEAR